ncbi:MAG TPA: ABC transporter ATP-binding protein [Geobacteraceae bacterium]|nr:ABC transporter ATP-binding protein [Geobacteraceae bacterium]
MPVFRLTDVRYSYLKKFPALNGIDLEIHAGESLVFLGSNGCGKSTMLKILNGLIFPASGEIRAFGEILDEVRLEKSDFRRLFRSRVGFVFQHSDIQLFCPTVFEELAFGPLQLGMSEADARERVKELLAMLGIKHLADRSPLHLSGGEKKRVAIASVLAMNPEVLLLDEPTNGLDPRTQRWLVDLVTELTRAGKTIITATHDLSMVDEIASRVVVISEEHRIAADGDPAVILSDLDLLLRANLISERPYAHAHLHYPWHRHEHSHGNATSFHDHPHREHKGVHPS